MPGIDECLLEAMLVPGARGASIVDWVSGLALGTIGETPGGDHEATAAETAELARVATEYAAFALLTPRASGGPESPPASGAGIPFQPDGSAVGAGRSGPGPIGAGQVGAGQAGFGRGADGGRGRPGTGPARVATADSASIGSDRSATGAADSAPAGGPAAGSAAAVGPATVGPAAQDESPLVEDFIVTTRTCYHLIRFVETAFDSSVFLHLWLDRDLGNLALARLRMQNLAERLVLG